MKLVQISEDNLVFDNSTTMSSYHDQQCCEQHWADFSVMEGYNLNTVTGKAIDIMNVEFNENIGDYIELVEDAGFNLVAIDGSKYFVPCYASNNGYYSSDLTLILWHDNVKVEIDITNCQRWDKD